MSFDPTIPMGPTSSAERRSTVVFTMVLLLVVLAVAWPEMASQALQGILWAGVGALMLAFPPEVRVPRFWLWLAAGFVLFPLLGFLPREWFRVASWRLDLEALGLDTGHCVFVQAPLAAETLTGFAATAVLAIFLLGHRVNSRVHHRLMLGFVLAVGIWTVAALYLHKPRATFGFFPNRNHSATLLAMAAFAGLGCFAQAVRQKEPWKIALSLIPTGLFLGVLFSASESRAGIVLVVAGFVAWIVLSGFGHLRGHVGKAVALLLLGLGGIFLIVDSTVKTRLDQTIEKIETPLPSTRAPQISFNEESLVQPDSNMDGRIAIYHDTWTMIQRENWTGIGPGQFAQVFPQYRHFTNASNNARCVHPESDWLMMLAETGWPATLCLAVGVLAVGFTALRQARSGRARFLRIGGLVAALLLGLHAIFDVPGHRVGLLWAAILLVAMSLRSPADDAADPAPGRPSRLVFRALGLGIFLVGAALFVAQWTNTPILPSAQAQHAMQDVKTLYDADQAAYNKAKAAGRDYQPSPAEDLLESALLRVDQAIHIAPLNPHTHYIRGALALHFDDKPGLAAQSFAIQRRLVPLQIKLVMDQALAWMLQDPQQTVALWQEALRRAVVEDARFSTNPSEVSITYQNLLYAARKDETLLNAALKLADMKPALLVFWARSVPAPMLDREMPNILPALPGAAERDPLFKIWKVRGSKGSAAAFAQAHPELAFPRP